jgi:protein-disulfide isomerase
MTAGRYREWFWNAATGVVMVMALVLGAMRLRSEFFVHSDSVPSAMRTKVVKQWRTFSSAGDRMGPAYAPVTIVEFSDFQCPYCRVASGDLHDLRRWYPDDVVIVYRHFPIHRLARPAAVAAECAGRQGTFEAFHDLLFANPESIGNKPWNRFAVEAHVGDTVEFDRCMDSRSATAVVDRDSAAAVALGVQGTPTFLINSLMVIGNPGFEQLNDYVKAALEGSHAVRQQ